jgi:hypothetical protein
MSHEMKGGRSMNAELVLLRVAVVLLLWGLPLAGGLIAQLGDWPRPLMAWAETRPVKRMAPKDKVAA